MSKFFITNSASLIQRVKETIQGSAYKMSFEFKGESMYAISTKKLVINNTNGVQCGDGFAIVTGTMAWEDGDAISTSILEAIHHSFNGDVNQIRKKSIGNFATSILKNGSLYVFGETAGFYNIYFYHIGKNWLISNSLYDIYIILKDRLTIDELCLTEASVQDGIMLDGTCFNEVKRLSGFNYLKVDSNKFEVIEEEHLYPMAIGTLEEKAERYKKISQSYGKRMSSAYGVPVISMTGGLDARMTLSSYLAADVKPHLYYGTGNSFITNTYNQDKEIDKQFAEKYGLIFHDESWATPEPVDKYWDKYLSLFGFYYETYAGSDSIMESIKNNPCQLFTYGYCGELLRNLPWIENRKREYFTLEEYLHEFYLPPKVKCQVIKGQEYEQHIWKKLIKICELYHLDINHIANEDIFYLSLERRKSADSAMVNLVNFMKYCSYSLGQYENLCAGRVTCQDASNSKFMLLCLNTLFPSVLDVPVFSHCTMRKINRSTMSLELPQKSYGSLFRNFISSVITNLPWLFILVKKIGGKEKNWRFQNDEIIYQYFTTLSNKYELFDIIHKRNISDKRDLVKYVMKLYAFNKNRL